MSDEVELESLIVRLIGDSSQYDDVMKAAEAELVAIARRITKEGQEAMRVHQDAMKEAAAITAAALTPQERYAQSVAKLGEHLSAGRISIETYGRSVNQLKSELPEVVAASRQWNEELAEGMRLSTALMTPVEKRAASEARLKELLDKGAISQDNYNRAVAKLAAESPRAIAAREYMNKLMAEGARLTNELRTPEENYRVEFAKLKELLKEGAISQDTFNRARERMNAALPENVAKLEAAKEAQRLLDEQMERGKTLTTAMLTPTERYKKDVEELGKLLRAGAISQETHTRAVAKAKEMLPEVARREKQIKESREAAKRIMEQIRTPQEQYTRRLAEINVLHRRGYLSANQHAKATRALAKEFDFGGKRAQAFAHGMRSAEAGLRNTGHKMLWFVTGPMAALGSGSVAAFAEFDQAMTETTSIMDGITEQQRTAMEELALAISSKTTTSAAELARTYYFLASAGYDAAGAMQVLNTVNEFAIAGAFDNELATELLTDSVAALGLAVDDTAQRALNMSRVADVLTKAANVSNASIEQFARSLTNKVAGQLRVLNKDVEEGVAVLMAYANQGEKAERGAEKMAIALTMLQKAANENAKVWEAAGVSVYDKATGKMRKLWEITENLEQSMAGFSDQQRAVRLQQLGFMAESQQAVTLLFGQADAMRGYYEELKKAGGVTKEVAERQMKSFSNQLKITWNQIKNVGIGIGRLLAPYILKLNEYLQYGISVWNTFSDEVKMVLVVLASLAAMAGPVLIFFGMIAGSIAAIVTVGAALAAVAKVLLIAAAVLAIVVPATLAWAGAIGYATYSLIGSDGFGAAWDWVKEKFAAFAEFAKGFFANFRQNVKILTEWFKSNWRTLILDAQQLLKVFATNGMHNLGVMFRAFQRLGRLWLGYMATTFWNLFTVHLPLAALEGLKILTVLLMRWAHDNRNFLLNMLTGQGMKVDMSAFFSKMNRDIKRGMKSTNFLGDAKDILREEMSGLRGMFEGFDAETPLPELALAIGQESGENLGEGIAAGVAAATAEAQAAIDELQLELAAEVQELTSSLQDQINTFGMSSVEADIYRLRMKGASEEQLKMVEALAETLKLKEEAKKLEDEGKELMEQFASPAEKLAKREARLNELLEEKAITQEVYNAALEDAKKQFGQGIDVDFRTNGIQGVVAGSVQAKAELAGFLRMQEEQMALAKGGDGAALAGPKPVVPIRRDAAVTSSGGTRTSGKTDHQRVVETTLGRIASGIDKLNQNALGQKAEV